MTTHTKVVFVGAGSYVFGPSILSQLWREQALPGVELALVDLDGETVEALAAVARRMAAEAGVEARVTAHTDRRTALAGADFVVCSASVQLHKRFAMDLAIIDAHAPGHLITEFGGIQGISYSLRQMALIEGLARDMQELCPEAWLLNSANPLPRVCQLAASLGVRTAGFCAVSQGAFGTVDALLGGAGEGYPWPRTQARYDLTMAGSNHFVWLVGARERATGEDLLPRLRASLAAGASVGQPQCERLARETGYLLLPCDNHCRDFLVPDGSPGWRETPSHGSADQRTRRLELLRGLAAGADGWDEFLANPAWERPVDFVAALAYGRPLTFTNLNLPNAGQIPNLPRGSFVETPCRVDASGPQPVAVELPPAVLPYALRTVAVTDALVAAALARSRAGVHAVVDLDPTIVDRAAGHRAIDACLAAHAELLPEFR